MLIEYLDNAAVEIEKMKKDARKMKRKHDETLDNDLLTEIAMLNKAVKVKRRGIWETIYDNMEEFRFMKRHFPQLFQVYAEDDAIGRIVRAKEWLAEFEEMEKNEAQKALEELGKARCQLKEMRENLKNWKEPFTKELGEIGNALLDRKVGENTSKHELTNLFKEKDSELRRKGWLIRLNEPFILKQVNRFLLRFRGAIKNEGVARKKFEDSNGRGTYWEYKAKQELNASIRERKTAERLCRHILLANPKFLSKFKRQNMLWRDKEIAAFMEKFLGNNAIPEINEKEWVREMRKKLEG